MLFAYGAVTLSGWPFQTDSTNDRICNSLRLLQRPQLSLTTPDLQRRRLSHSRFGLFPFRSPLLRE